MIDFADLNIKMGIAFTLLLIAFLLTYIVITRDSKRHK